VVISPPASGSDDDPTATGSNDGVDSTATADGGETPPADAPGEDAPEAPSKPHHGLIGGTVATLVGGDSLFARYARSTSVHVAVLVVLAVYPFVHAFFTNPATYNVVPVLSSAPEYWSLTAVAVLPRVETMVAIFYFGLFAASFDFISGYTGYLSFGHAAFYGLGAYGVILVANGKLPLLGSQTPFMLTLLVMGVAAAVLAVLVGLVSFRLSGVYFAMITLGFSQILYVLFQSWDFVGENPRDGVAVLEHPEGFDIGVPFVDALNLAIGQLQGDSVTYGLDMAKLGFDFLGFIDVTIDLGGAEVSYYMIGLIAVLGYVVMQRIIHSPFGRVMIAIRENEARARAIGYDVYKVKLAAFAMSAFFGAIAGGLFAGFRRSVSPENSLYFLVAGDALLASVIGGFGTLAGPIFGRLFHISIEEFLSKSGSGGGLLPWLESTLGDGTMGTELVGGVTVGEGVDTFLNGHAELYVGLVFVLFVLYVPNGLLGTIRVRMGGTVAGQTAARIKRWAAGATSANAGASADAEAEDD
jgi:branched-chain amino acid transport system permease protein